MRPETDGPDRARDADRQWRSTRRLVMVIAFLVGVLAMTLAGQMVGLYEGYGRSGSSPAAPAAASSGRP